MACLRKIFVCSLFLVVCRPTLSHAAGVTIITHGLNGNVDGWVLGMAGQVDNYYRFLGTNVTCYEIYFALTNTTYTPTWRRIAGPPFSALDSGEIVVKLDWRQLADNSYSTYQVAAMVVPRLMQNNFISELSNHALTSLPLHLIGHSRGGSLVCEMSRLLGTNGIWVDHLTTLDPHPLNNDGFSDFPYTVVDASAQTYENVLFHDNYFQTLNLVFYGESVPGAYVRKLTNLDGGYDGAAASHSDVHLWYHGTVDLRVPASDTEASIGATERQTWWSAYESQGTNAGFHYSLIGGGNRLSPDQPAGSAHVREGYNQIWDFGAGTSNNRVFLPANNGNSANVLRFNLTGTNLVAQGQTNTVRIYAQWAKPATSNAVVGIYLDDDLNPYTGNERLIHQFNMQGTTRNQIFTTNVSLNLNGTNSSPGVYALFAKITGGNRNRNLYAPETLTVFSTFQSPRLAITRSTNSQVFVDVIGTAGQRIILQDTTDLQHWRPLTTNWLATSQFRYSTVTSGDRARFYRAALQ